MEVGVKVWVENLHTRETRHTSSAYVTYVALDIAGSRVLLDQVVPETPEDERRFERAAERREHRLALRARAVADQVK
jgi:acyl-CoA hydrolase